MTSETRAMRLASRLTRRYLDIGFGSYLVFLGPLLLLSEECSSESSELVQGHDGDGGRGDSAAQRGGSNGVHGAGRNVQIERDGFWRVCCSCCEHVSQRGCEEVEKECARGEKGEDVRKVGREGVDMHSEHTTLNRHRSTASDITYLLSSSSGQGEVVERDA